MDLRGTGSRRIAVLTVAGLLSTAACTDTRDIPPRDPGAPTPGTSATADPGDPRKVDLSSARLDLPPWPDPALRTICPSGVHTFTDGAVLTTSDRRYFMSILGPPTYTDLDGAAGEEILTTIGCGPPESDAAVAALAMRVTSDNTAQVLGYVQGAGNFAGSVARTRVNGQRVELTTRTGSGPDATEQTRTFLWRNDEFMLS